MDRTFRRKADAIRREFDRSGHSIAEYARANDLPPRAVYDLLTGRSTGKRGDCHRAAVLLGLKDGTAQAS